MIWIFRTKKKNSFNFHSRIRCPSIYGSIRIIIFFGKSSVYNTKWTTLEIDFDTSRRHIPTVPGGCLTGGPFEEGRGRLSRYASVYNKYALA